MMIKPLLHILLWLLFSATGVYSQTLYVPGKIVQGENATYYCKAWSKLFVEIENVNNTDTTNVMYYEDGTLVPEDNGYYPTEYVHSQADLDSIFREALTSEEWEMIKGKSGYILMIEIVADILGNTRELSFVFRNDDPVLSKFTPDRFYQLEQKFKEVIKFVWQKPAGKRERNVKYTQSIGYRHLR